MHEVVSRTRYLAHGTARVKEEEEGDSRIIVLEGQELWKIGNVSRYKKSPREGLTIQVPN